MLTEHLLTGSARQEMEDAAGSELLPRGWLERPPLHSTHLSLRNFCHKFGSAPGQLIRPQMSTGSAFQPSRREGNLHTGPSPVLVRRKLRESFQGTQLGAGRKGEFGLKTLGARVWPVQATANAT